MLYIECEKYKNKYHKALEDLDELLDIQEELFSKTQPKSTDFNKESVSGGTPSNSFDTYLIKKQKLDLDKKIAESRAIVQDRKALYELKLDELKTSKDALDIVYLYVFVKRLSYRKAERLAYMSRSEIGRKVEIIEKSLNLGQNETKSILK